MAVVSKVCCRCGIDVSQLPRTKDSQGSYYCQPCWAARAGAAGQQEPRYTTPAVQRSAPVPPKSKTGLVVAAIVGAVVITFLATLWLVRPPRDDSRREQARASGSSDADKPVTAAPFGAAEDRRLQELIVKRGELKHRLQVEIPSLKNKLAAQAEEAKKSMAAASTAGEKMRLQTELREIAQSELSIERHEKDVRGLLTQLESGGRQLERFKDLSRTTNTTDAQLRAELEQMERDIGARLAVPLDLRLGSGPIEDFELSAKLDAIMNRKEAPQYVVVVPESSSTVQAYTAMPNAATQGQMEQLFETARANDNVHNGKLALAALEKILQTNPTNAQARSLRNKIMRYYGPITLTVPLDYPTIQQAIDAAQSGDVVMLKPGNYREAIVLKEGIAVAGEDTEGCRLLPAVGYEAVVSLIGLDKCAIRNLTIDGENTQFTEVYQYGCPLETVTGQVLVKNSIDPQSPAAKAGMKAGAKLLNINGVPVTTAGAAFRMLADHAVHFPGKPVVIQAELSGKSELYQLVAQKREPINTERPVGVLCVLTGGEITKCKITNLPRGIMINNCPNSVTVNGNRFLRNSVGVTVFEASKAVISQNSYQQNSTVAIAVSDKGTTAVIEKNRCVGNRVSIIIEKGASAKIEDNECMADAPRDSPVAVFVQGTETNAVLRGNKLTSGLCGLWAKPGSTVVAEGNTIEGISDVGVMATGPRTDVRLLSNKFINTNPNSHLPGVMVSDGATLTAEGNTFGNLFATCIQAEDTGTTATLLKNTFVGKKPDLPQQGGNLNITKSHVIFAKGSRGKVIGNTFTGETGVYAKDDNTQVSVTDNDFTEVVVPIHHQDGGVIEVSGNNKGMR